MAFEDEKRHFKIPDGVVWDNWRVKQLIQQANRGDSNSDVNSK